MELGEKNEKGERIKVEYYIKKGGKGLKNASLWAINSKMRLARRKLICWEKNESQKRGWGIKIIKMHNIYPCLTPGKRSPSVEKRWAAAVASRKESAKKNPESAKQNSESTEAVVVKSERKPSVVEASCNDGEIEVQVEVHNINTFIQL